MLQRRRERRRQVQRWLSWVALEDGRFQLQQGVA